MPTTQKRNLSDERRAEILEAFVRCIHQFGLEKSSLHRVAAEAGVTQPLIMHHFGSRAGLVDSLIDLVVAEYQLGLVGQLSGRSMTAKGLLNFLYKGGMLKSIGEHDVIFPELFAIAPRNNVLREKLAELFVGLVKDVALILKTLYPHAAKSEVETIAYGLVALREGDDVIAKMKPNTVSNRAYKCGEQLLATLGPTR